MTPLAFSHFGAELNYGALQETLSDERLGRTLHCKVRGVHFGG
jgi:hypothetical protein